ncbi:DUF4192 domain-containing protein [Rhodococcus sp. NPDC019627]|uniref:DUF4192 domain-containing protein n=1 Tax=unclassified Rhodococcus (in: high G+C Gram-positive bacteria) TaxID=192944 RepID=UPI0033F8BFF5
MIRLRTATDVLAAIPAMLGFTPVQSIVAILLGQLDDADGITGTRIVVAARYDADQDAEISAERLCGIAARENVTGVILAVIAGGLGAAAALDNMTTLRDRLAAEGVAPVLSLHTAELTEGSMWIDLDTLERGAVPDPTTSAVHAAVVFDGRNVATSRTAIAARYGLAAEADPRIAARAAAEQGDDFARATITEFAAVIRNGEIPSADLAARVGLVAASGPTQRDAFLGLAHYGAAEAHAAMILVANQVRGQARVQTLTITAYFAYIAGTGPEAGIAIDAARASADDAPEAETRLLDLLDIALQRAMRPDTIAGLTAAGVESAQKLGVEFD